MNKETQPIDRETLLKEANKSFVSMRIRSQGLKPPASRSVMACWYLPATTF